MKNPLYDRTHLREYILYGLIAAILYSVFLFAHFRSGDYKSSYLLFIGNALFGAAIFVYNMQLIKRPYDKHRSTAMLIAAHLATAIGTFISIIFCVALMIIFHPEIFTANQAGAGIENAPPNSQLEIPSGWMLMVCFNALIINFGIGSFVSVMVSYAGKRNQTKDRATDLGQHVPNKRT